MCPGGLSLVISPRLQDLLSLGRDTRKHNCQSLHIPGHRQALPTNSCVCFRSTGLGEGEILLAAAVCGAQGTLEWFSVRHEPVFS